MVVRPARRQAPTESDHQDTEHDGVRLEIPDESNHACIQKEDKEKTEDHRQTASVANLTLVHP